MSAPQRRPPPIIESFNHAFEGVIHVLRTQRNMRIHFVVAAVVLILGLAYRGGQKEASFSSALLLIGALHERGARALLHDPLFSAEAIAAVGAEPAASIA